MRYLLAALLLTAAAPALAWGQNGHRITGAIADRHLSPKARAGLMEILGTEGLAEASTWADFMRSAPGDFWQKDSTPFHYVTIPIGKGYSGAPPQGDAVTALAKYSAVLRDPRASLADRQQALRFVIHIVGDLSQPLHVGREGDRGGNDVKVSFFGSPSNLHTVWDTLLLENQNLSYSEFTPWLLAAASPAQMRDWSSADPMQWIADSIVVRETIYPANPDLGYAYVYEQNDNLRRQLTKGGLRLASYLNALFDAPVAK
ncbi:S1/P1 nuclease [Sandaracinobacter neustonicus]|uniref:S1/P1 nuclease n=1 Tax=Sandaracinobacter neustonicus TaxID=1715348 RepID=A0A501XPV3_9SPHN|nr:S1/P1 nuclease [Sandaracinobacter neustonicus]TPE62439.1 S1/P1 nuclease [Sandaracinobacter neustonicus]